LDLPGPDVLVTRDCARPAAGAPSSPSVVAGFAGCEPDRCGGGAGAGSGAVGSGAVCSGAACSGALGSGALGSGALGS
jgi:hypothetical protein